MSFERIKNNCYTNLSSPVLLDELTSIVSVYHLKDFPNPPFYATINQEIVKVSSINRTNNTLTVDRAQLSTTRYAHKTNDSLCLVLTSNTLRNISTDENFYGGLFIQSWCKNPIGGVVSHNSSELSYNYLDDFLLSIHTNEEKIALVDLDSVGSEIREFDLTFFKMHGLSGPLPNEFNSYLLDSNYIRKDNICDLFLYCDRITQTVRLFVKKWWSDYSNSGDNGYYGGRRGYELVKHSTFYVLKDFTELQTSIQYRYIGTVSYGPDLNFKPEDYFSGNGNSPSGVVRKFSEYVSIYDTVNHPDGTKTILNLPEETVIPYIQTNFEYTDVVPNNGRGHKLEQIYLRLQSGVEKLKVQLPDFSFKKEFLNHNVVNDIQNFPPPGYIFSISHGHYDAQIITVKYNHGGKFLGVWNSGGASSPLRVYTPWLPGGDEFAGIICPDQKHYKYMGIFSTFDHRRIFSITSKILFSLSNRLRDDPSLLYWKDYDFIHFEHSETFPKFSFDLILYEENNRAKKEIMNCYDRVLLDWFSPEYNTKAQYQEFNPYGRFVAIEGNNLVLEIPYFGGFGDIPTDQNTTYPEDYNNNIVVVKNEKFLLNKETFVTGVNNYYRYEYVYVYTRSGQDLGVYSVVDAKALFGTDEHLFAWKFPILRRNIGDTANTTATIGEPYYIIPKFKVKRRSTETITGYQEAPAEPIYGIPIYSGGTALQNFTENAIAHFRIGAETDSYDITLEKPCYRREYDIKFKWDQAAGYWRLLEPINQNPYV